MAAADKQFANLQKTAQRQPPSVGDIDPIQEECPAVPEVHVQLNGRETETSTVSDHFRGLLDGLYLQHLTEMAELEARLCSHMEATTPLAPVIAPSECMEDTPYAAPVNSLEMPRGNSSLMLSPRLPKSSSQDSSSVPKSVHPNAGGIMNSSSAMRLRRTHKKEIQASEVLEALDKEQALQQLFEAPITSKALGASPTTSELKFTTNPFEWRSAEATGLEKLRLWLQSSRFEMLITTVLCINVLWMALELQVYGSYRAYEVGVVAESTIPQEWLPSIDVAFQIGDGIFTAFFVFDVGLRIALLGRRFFKVCMNYIDLLVTAASVVELIVSQVTVNPMLFRLLRIGKLARALRMVTMSSVLSSLQLLIKCLSASADMLVWTFCLLTFIQCVAGMVVSTLCSEFLKDTGQSIELREEVYRYYGTFTRTFLTMFEILFANWSPPCRVLVENVSEWFSVFFLLYRCVLGFAVLNVVNAVFVQQTMKTASSDEELAFKQKEKDIAAYARKVRRLFQTMDDSNDGAISLEEFSKLVTSPKLKFWMSQLELEYHDLLSLFEFLDNGDEQITLQEFIEGASRLRGHAKALDVWRLETKLEVLFEEMLRLQSKEDSSPQISSFVQNAFKNSLYSHIKSNARSQHRT